MSHGEAKGYGPDGCQVPEGNGKCGETKTLGILDEFKTLYETRMKQLDDEIRAGGDCLQAKLTLQEQWIKDLMEQNEMMARTVEQLEIEATERVQMLEEKLQSSAKCICEVMKRYRELSSSLHLDEPFQKMFYLENDLKNLLEFIRRIRDDNRWSIEGLQFYDVAYKDLFGDKGCTRNECPVFGPDSGGYSTKVGKSLKVSFEILGSDVSLRDDNVIPCPYSTPTRSPAIETKPLPCSCCAKRAPKEVIIPCPNFTRSRSPPVESKRSVPCCCSSKRTTNEKVIACTYSKRPKGSPLEPRRSLPCSCSTKTR